jgi:hypothetical protein
LSEARSEPDVPSPDVARQRPPVQEDFDRPNVAEPAVQAETAEVESEGPREARKGWWQRRFKM